MGIIKLESYFFQSKKFFFSKYCQNCNRKYCEFHTALLQVWNHLSIQEWKCSYTFETYNFTKLKDKNSRMMKLYRKNWKVQTVRSYSKKIVHDFCRGAQGSDFFFFSFFHTSRIPREVRPAGLRVLHLYVLLIDPCPAASSTCGDEKAAHGQRHGRGERAHAEYREWKPRAPLAGWNGAGTRNQGLHLPAANYPAWKKLRTEQPVPLTFLPSSTLFLALFSNSTASFQISPRFRALHRISGRMNKDLSFMGGGIKMNPSTEVVFCVDLSTRRRVSLLINSSKREI